MAEILTALQSYGIGANVAVFIGYVFINERRLTSIESVIKLLAARSTLNNG